MEEAESSRPGTAGVIAQRLEVSRRELLDLGLRNPLLNYRLLRAFKALVESDFGRS